MGQSLRREPSRLEGVQAAGSLLPNRTSDPGRLDSLASKLLCSRRDARRLARDHASPLTAKTRQRADMGFESPTVVLADRIRWQKSTNVAWPKARTGEEPGQAVESSLLLQRAKRRKSVGSLLLVAKPTPGGGLAFEVPVRKRGAEQAFVDGRRLDLTRLGVLDGKPTTRGQETGSILRERPRLIKASEGLLHTCRVEDNAARQGKRTEGVSIGHPLRIGPFPHRRRLREIRTPPAKRHAPQPRSS